MARIGKHAEGIAGRRFGRLVAIERLERRTPNKARVWLCRCDCGATTEVPAPYLRNGNTQSCGCLKRDATAKRNRANAIDLTSEHFGRLIALRPTGEVRGSRRVWACLCECGATIEVTASQLRRGSTRSCGCLAREMTAARSTTHGGSGGRHPLYSVWRGIHERCLNPDGKDFHRYGGRGITVCARWQGPGGFLNFVADMGDRPSASHSIDRRDNNGPYAPENCRWATPVQQSHNRRPISTPRSRDALGRFSEERSP